MAAALAALQASAGEVGGLVLVVAVIAAVAWLGRRQEVRKEAARRLARPVVRRSAAGPLVVASGWAAGPPDPLLPPAADPWESADQELVDAVRLTLLDLSPAVAR